MARVKPKVLVTEPIHQDGLDLLKPEVELILKYGLTPGQLLEEIARVEAVIVRSLTDVNREVIKNGVQLQVIGKHGVGVDSVDIEAATEFGIPVVHTPEACTISTAEHTVGLIIALAMRLVFFDGRLRQGDFGVRERIKKVQLRGKTLGIIGYGKIGREVARMCRDGFGMKVVTFVHKTNIQPDGEITIVNNMDEVLTSSDFVSLHVPATKETIRLIGRRELELMKQSAYLINASRGALVDEEALIEALKAGKIAGAGLDVFASEPPDPQNPLFKMDNVIVTPHHASLTEEEARSMGVTIAEEVLAVLKGEEPRFIANPNFRLFRRA
jgi:D-3-phosphoglycerate dehydrogenase